jgi:hypothetical protein
MDNSHLGYIKKKLLNKNHWSGSAFFLLAIFRQKEKFKKIENELILEDFYSPKLRG